MPGATWSRTHWDAVLAHATVQRAVASGTLVVQPCEQCGATSVVAHHDNYADRLEVRWLCHSHHRLWHLAHPVDHQVLAPERRARPLAERPGPNRGRMFRRYLKPRALRLRGAGATYQDIAQTLGVSTATAHAWCKE